ncbi:putative archaeal/bacterial/fungal rhodopsin, rhodopsin, retinal binding, yro2-like, 7TM [Septoria linicola]|nr:putative archaeal/bacterial/fungal rhodopsin, rhodopsin, retinal binding, yro2-like, 7TM [Septoria linicola]
MADLLKRNSAVDVNGNMVNGQTVDIAITEDGSDVYFAFCAIMGFVGLGVLAASLAKPRTHRIFFYITAAVNITACIAYFSMGSNLGWTPIDVEFQRSDSKVSGVNREIFYARYIDWFVTTPLLILDLLLTAGVPWPTIIWTIFLDWVMIVTGLVGALVSTRYKWGYYAAGCAAMFGVFYNLVIHGRKSARHLGPDVARTYTICGVLTLVVWALYPIAWGLGEGGNVIAPDSEAVFYGVLDFLAKPVFSIALVVGHWKIDPTRMGLVLRDYDSEPNYFGTYTPGHAAYGEKPANGTNGQVVDGTADGSGAPVINAPV